MTRIWPNVEGVTNLPIFPIPGGTIDMIADWAPITLQTAIWIP